MINQEEYEILKSLDNMLKWISRDKDSDIFIFEEKPYKRGGEWVTAALWKDGSDFGHDYVDEVNLFQFIQWKDEEPYLISDLINEYEESQPYEIFNRELESLYEESEEVEMKKDIEWAKKEVKELMTEESQNYPHDEMVEKEIILGILNQLDEPEKVVVPKFVAEWLTEARDDSLYGLLEKVNHLITTDYKWREWWERKVKGETFSEIQSIIAKAVINGYKVEKEPKYCVVLPEITGSNEKYLVKANDSGNLWIDGGLGYIKRLEDISYKFTEQEIKEFDDRYWAFAVPVEEVE